MQHLIILVSAVLSFKQYPKENTKLGTKLASRVPIYEQQ
jgi:hypothetical protein